MQFTAYSPTWLYTLLITYTVLHAILSTFFQHTVLIIHCCMQFFDQHITHCADAILSTLLYYHTALHLLCCMQYSHCIANDTLTELCAILSTFHPAGFLCQPLGPGCEPWCHPTRCEVAPVTLQPQPCMCWDPCYQTSYVTKVCIYPCWDPDWVVWNLDSFNR